MAVQIPFAFARVLSYSLCCVLALSSQGKRSCEEAQLDRWRSSRNASISDLYSAEMARAMANLATLAYCNSIPGFGATPLNACVGTCEQAGFQVARNSASGFGQAFGDTGYVARFNRTTNTTNSRVPDTGCLLVFRGMSTANQSANASGRLTAWRSGHCKDCMVFDAYNDVWEAVHQVVIDALASVGCGNGSALFITGHSNGAAVATLAMFALREAGYDIQVSYNFQSPRVGNVAFAKAFDGLFNRPVSLFRITQANDVIPRTPMRQDGYASVGVQVWYPNASDASDYVVCPADDDNSACGVDALRDDCTVEPSLRGPHCQSSLAPASERGFCIQGLMNGSVASTVNGMYLANEACIHWLMDEGITPIIEMPTAPPDAQKKLPGMIKELDAAMTGDNTSTSQRLSLSDVMHGVNLSGHAEAAAQRMADAADNVARNSSTNASSNSSRARSTTDEREERRDKLNASALNCYEDNVTYAPLDMLGHAMTKEANASECHARCSRTADCSFFTFYTLTRDCHVTGEAALKQVGIGCVGGPVDCGTVEASFLTRSVNTGNGQTMAMSTSRWWFLASAMMLGMLVVASARSGGAIIPILSEGIRRARSLVHPAKATELETLVERNGAA